MINPPSTPDYDLEALIDYFANLGDETDIFELDRNLFETCVKFFLDSNLKLRFKKTLEEQLERIHRWENKTYLQRNNLDLTPTEKAELEQERNELNLLRLVDMNCGYLMTVIEKLKATKRSKWEIEHRRYMREMKQKQTF